jgi:hypothetical protein
VIPEAVPVEGIAPEAAVLEGATTEPEVPVAPEPTEEAHDDALPESSMDVVVRSPEIQDAEPIRSAPMSEAAPTSRGLAGASVRRPHRPGDGGSELGDDASDRVVDEGT